MPRVETEQALIPEGEHFLTLKSVSEKEFEDKFHSNGGEPTVRWQWKFTSREMDENDCPYTLVIFTNTKYGNANASLTTLLDMLIPEITLDEAKGLDTDDLIGNRYKVRIKHVVNQSGKKAPKITLCQRLKARAAEPPPEPAPKKRPAADDDEEPAPKKKRPPVDDNDDPFADE